MSNKERTEKVLNLFSMYPRTFSIKEITEFYSSLGIHINRNSLRKTLDELVLQEKIKSTRQGNDKKGRRYFLSSVVDLYANLSTIITDVNYLQQIGEHLTLIFPAKIRRYEGFDISGVLNANLKIIKLSYPFLTINYDHQGNLETSTTFQAITVDDRSAKIRVAPCLCKGKNQYNHACSMVAGSIKKITSELIDPSVSVRWIYSHSGKDSYCDFSVEIRGDIAEKYQTSRIDLDDPAQRERTIPGL